MKNLPAEMLEIIFKELCSLQDIQHCYKTCSKWQNITYLQMLKATTETWIVDPTKNFEISKGPKLKVARYGHSCNTMKINGILHVVVAGGETGRFTPKRYYKILNSVELLDPTSPNERSFDLGPRLPFRLTRATMMTSITGKSVIVIGGSKTNGFDDNSVNNKLLHWNYLETPKIHSNGQS